MLALVETGDERAVDALRTYVEAMQTAPRNWLWLTAVALLADGCIALGDRRSARVLERALRPYRSDTVVVAPRDRHARDRCRPARWFAGADRRAFADHKEVASAS